MSERGLLVGIILCILYMVLFKRDSFDYAWNDFCNIFNAPPVMSLHK